VEDLKMVTARDIIDDIKMIFKLTKGKIQRRVMLKEYRKRLKDEKSNNKKEECWSGRDVQK
jgi:hypothetical protein